MTKPHWPDDNVILYDGICVFCSRWIQFVVSHDTAKVFRFTPIQSDYGRELANTFHINPDDPDTNAVIHDGLPYFRSDAALIVLSMMPRWRWICVLRFLPKTLRDSFYSLVANNRYRIFGKWDVCYMGGEAFKDRVLT